MSDYYGELCTKLYESSKSYSEGKELDFYLSFVKDENMKVLEPMNYEIELNGVQG
jgi:hypothetical protein